MLARGEEVDRYVVDALVGEGGMARVYRVRHRSLGTVHALKVLAVTTASARRRAAREARVQASLDHPNLVSVADTFDLDGAPCLLMEYVHGPTLAAWLQAHRPTPAEAMQLFNGVWDGVSAAHALGLVHRDLKPGNVLLDVTGETVVPKVTDFGLVKVVAGDEPTATATGMLLGTPAYASPEQLLDPRMADLRSDRFSLGCVLYEMLCGVRPFDGPSIPAIYALVKEGAYVPPRERRPDLPDELVELIEGLLQTAPEDRLTDPAAVVKHAWGRQATLPRDTPGGAVAVALAGAHPDEIVPLRPATETAVRSPLRGRWAQPAGLVLVLLVVIFALVGAVQMVREPAEPPPPPSADATPPTAAVSGPVRVADRAPHPVAASAPAPVVEEHAVAAPPVPVPPAVPAPDTDAVPAEPIDEPLAAADPPDPVTPPRPSLVMMGSVPSGLYIRLVDVAAGAGFSITEGQVSHGLGFGDEGWRALRDRHPDLPALAVEVDPAVTLGPHDAAVADRPDPDQLVARLALLHPALTSLGAIHTARDPWWDAIAASASRRGIGLDLREADRRHLSTHLEHVFSRSQILLIAPSPSLWSPDALAEVYTRALSVRGGAFPVVAFDERHFDGAQAPTLVGRASPTSRDDLAVELLTELLRDGGGGQLHFPDLVLVARSKHAILEATGLALTRRSDGAIDGFAR